MNTVRIIKWLRVINALEIGDILIISKGNWKEHFKLAKRGTPSEIDLYSIDKDDKVWGIGADNLEEFKKYFLIDGIKGHYEDVDVIQPEEIS